jgi:hypothetical protein
VQLYRFLVKPFALAFYFADSRVTGEALLHLPLPYILYNRHYNIPSLMPSLEAMVSTSNYVDTIFYNFKADAHATITPFLSESFKAQDIAECAQPETAIPKVAITHNLTPISFISDSGYMRRKL